MIEPEPHKLRPHTEQRRPKRPRARYRKPLPTTDHPDEIIAKLTQLGPYFTVGHRDTGHPITDLYQDKDGALTNLLTTYAKSLATTERRVAASIMFQGFAARLWSPALACVAQRLPMLDLSPTRLRWQGQPFGLVLSDLRTTTTRLAELIDDHLVPMVAALHAKTGVAENLLWGNAASALVGTLTVLRINDVPTGTATTMVRELLETGPLRGTGTFDGSTFRRRSCCLYYRVPGGGLCGDCCLSAAPQIGNGDSDLA
jgi:iron complex transport system ATP-binding protein